MLRLVALVVCRIPVSSHHLLFVYAHVQQSLCPYH